MFAFNKQLWDFGTQIEDKVKPLLNKQFDCDFKKSDDIWDVLDFHDNDKKIICEIKGRKINSNEYDTTIIPMNKVTNGLMKVEEGFKVYFVFVFLDKTLYCELTEDLEYQVKLTGTNYIKHALIKVDALHPLPQGAAQEGA
tara:strand:+ start:236 stop:658 length:423 start_codon:yes stop_codon:yes gene_type:complete